MLTRYKTIKRQFPYALCLTACIVSGLAGYNLKPQVYQQTCMIEKAALDYIETLIHHAAIERIALSISDSELLKNKPTPKRKPMR